ncbi:hypothetical protein ACFY04_37765 [Streptomyces sp. NPDC001549]|uniref:hypothetical protein n=1 Tax=Streptomyces sp. NPDC001549 TaxID=3364586 RepID=UPI0036D11232
MQAAERETEAVTDSPWVTAPSEALVRRVRRVLEGSGPVRCPVQDRSAGVG